MTPTTSNQPTARAILLDVWFTAAMIGFAIYVGTMVHSFMHLGTGVPTTVSGTIGKLFIAFFCAYAMFAMYLTGKMVRRTSIYFAVPIVFGMLFGGFFPVYLKHRRTLHDKSNSGR